MKRNKRNIPERIVITGGGTGGHVFPAISIGNALEPFIGRKNLLYIGAKGKMEMDKVPEAGFTIKGLPVRGITRLFSLAGLLLPIRLLVSVVQAFFILVRFRPKAVVGVGGFASAPALVVAKLLGIPIVIQEQNSIPGKVNRYFGKRASLICTAFPGMERHFGGRRVVMTGNPVRSELSGAGQLRAAGCEYFGLNKEKPVVLLIGGSQGARSMNLAMELALPGLVQAGIQVIWQTGKVFHAQAEALIKERSLSGVVALPFIREMDMAYGAASLVVARAGALTIAEIALTGRPSILVPFPFAAEDHQSVNASAVARLGGAKLLPDNKVKEELADLILTLINDPGSLQKMSRQVQKMGSFGADTCIAKMVRDVIAGYNLYQRDYMIGSDNVKKVYFLGAGGIGMSALVRWFLMKGVVVHGYDRTPTPLTATLEREGAKLHYNDRPDLIPSDTDLVVITPAIPSSLQERRAVLELGVPVMKRAELLGMVSRAMKTIAIAGTHGKTSTSSLVTHLLQTAEIPVTAFIGGITKSNNSNFVFSEGSRYLVVEADEFDRSFLHLAPDFSVITSTDADHLDVYETHDQMKQAFARFGALNGQQPLMAGPTANLTLSRPLHRYSASGEDVPWRAENIVDEGLSVRFDLVLDGEVWPGMVLGIPGRHNVENAVAAAAAAQWAGASKQAITEGLASYRGVVRRFDIQIDRDDLLYIDDYAHHPRELDACIASVKKVRPGKPVTGIFQPHLFTRTRDFANEFAASLEQLDNIILLDIYPAREEPIPGVSSQMILEKIKHQNKTLIPKEEVVDHLAKNPPEVLITMGAGDIDTIVPDIADLFKKEVSS